MKRWLVMIAALAGGLVSARVDARVQRGTVVLVVEREVYFDLGTGEDVAAGMPLRVKRPIRLTHPGTGAIVTDELPLFEATVDMASERLSMVRVADEHPLPGAGDVIEVLIAEPEPEVAAAPPAAPRSGALVLWDATAGTPVNSRARAYRQYLDEHPDAPFAEALAQDLERFEAFREELVAQQRSRPEPGVSVEGFAHDGPAQAARQQGLRLAFVAAGTPVTGAWLHFRTMGEPTYRRTALRPDGDAYLRGEIPAGELVAPGVEYFVEVAAQDGTVGPVAGTPASPLQVIVEAPAGIEAFADKRQRSRVSIRATYLDFATFDDRPGDHRDRFLLTEADFLYLLRSKIWGVRAGLGILNGRGGDADMAASESSGFQYTYVEFELRPQPSFGLAGRLVAGLGDDGVGFGGEGRVRLGEPLGTYLEATVSSLHEIGFLSELRLQWDVLRAFPMGFAVAATDQPAQGDVGVRLSADLGLRVFESFTPTFRVSYQGRSAAHTGLGGGLGLVFDW